MNTFYRICIYLALAMILFNMIYAFSALTGAYGYTETGKQIKDEQGRTIETGLDAGGVFSVLTGLDSNDAFDIAVFMSLSSLLGVGAIVTGYVFRSFLPVGIWLFSEVFWASWNGTRTALEFNVAGGQAIPGTIIIIFFAAALFIFIAAIVGMLTGSG